MGKNKVQRTDSQPSLQKRNGRGNESRAEDARPRSNGTSHTINGNGSHNNTVYDASSEQDRQPDTPPAGSSPLPRPTDRVLNGDSTTSTAKQVEDTLISLEPIKTESLGTHQHSEMSPSLLSTTPIAESLATPTRIAQIQLVRIKRPGRRACRIGIKVMRPNPLPDSEFILEPVTSNLTSNITEFIPEPPPVFQSDFLATFGPDALDMVEANAKLHSSSGQHLPIQLRDLFPALSDPTSALGIANALRSEHDLPHLTPSKANRIELRRVIAQMREKLYVELVSALSLPLAPDALESDDEAEAEVEGKPSLSMTPTNLDILSRTLLKTFPHEKAVIKPFLADGQDAAYGEKEGKVVWQGGVGRMLGGEGVGFREKAIMDGPVHVFVDQ